jgi:hypothetical protein
VLRPLLESGILLAAIVSVLLNLLFNGLAKTEAAFEEAAVAAGASGARLRLDAPMRADPAKNLCGSLCDCASLRDAKLRSQAKTQEDNVLIRLARDRSEFSPRREGIWIDTMS